MLTCAFFQWALWSLLVAEDAWAEKQDPESCLLQHRPLPPELAPFPAPTESTQRMWTTPGVHFQQCSTRKQSPASPILALQVNDSQLPPKPTCQPGEMLIGSFENDSYVFTCCAGEECSGCSVMRESSCAQCASGFVWQTMPIVNKSRCFICDDLPEWKDAKGRTCADYESICDGGWPDLEKDKAFQGLRPSEACCTCGGGSISPTPVSLPLAAEVLFQGQAVDAYPEPSAMERVEVDAGCDLESGGLALSTSGRIHGTVHAQAIKCQITVVQDSVRGLSSQLVLDVPVHDFSYGSSVVMFKSWRLDDLPAEEATKTVQHSNKEKLSDFALHCVPECSSWLSIDKATGELQAVRTITQKDDTWGAVHGFQMPGCSCQVLASDQPDHHVNTSFVAVRARLWKAGVYEGVVLARVGQEIVPVRLKEALGNGLRWYRRPGHKLDAPVVENPTSGETFVVPEAFPPSILDVKCTAQDDPDIRFVWSRTTGDVSVSGQVAFNLDPESGTVSGTPKLDLPQAAGHSRLHLTCMVALGGSLYDRVLPVAKVSIQMEDNTCWVPAQLPGPHKWQRKILTFMSKGGANEATCLLKCRREKSCGAVQYVAHDLPKQLCQRPRVRKLLDFGVCWMQSSSGLVETRPGTVLVRVNDCMESSAELRLEVPGALVVAGNYAPTGRYKHLTTYSRPGLTAQRQLIFTPRKLVHSELPPSCEDASWVLLHANSSDWKNENAEPEFYGSALACARGPVVQDTFAKGATEFSLRFVDSFVHDRFDFGNHDAVQAAHMSITVPSCSKPAATAELVYGTVTTPGFHSLSVCECFGEAYASTEPVDQGSNAAVPRRDHGEFNVGPLDDLLIFRGPYTCEETARLETVWDMDMELCRERCHRDPTKHCSFYLFEPTSRVCSLFKACNFIQNVGFELSNELWGLPPEGKFCRIADAEACWETLRRRSYLSFTPSTLPRCVFQHQLEACDALQMISGTANGECSRCQFLDASEQRVRAGLAKQPLPDEFPAGSQIEVSCNETSRMFSDSKGPKAKVTFTCVGGDWVGESQEGAGTSLGGPWEQLENLTCQECIQVGTPDLQRFSNVSLAAVYFMEHRQVQATFGNGIPGCLSASHPTAAALVWQQVHNGANFFLDVKKDGELILSQKTSTTWWIDAVTDQVRSSTGRRSKCICFKDGNLRSCDCKKGNEWTLDRKGRLTNQASMCISGNDVPKLTVSVCPAEPEDRFRWYFDGGSCVFDMDIVDTAALTWIVSVPSQGQGLLLTTVTTTWQSRHRSVIQIQSTQDSEYRLVVRADDADGWVQAVRDGSSLDWVVHDNPDRISMYDTSADHLRYLSGRENEAVFVRDGSLSDTSQVGWKCDEYLTKGDGAGHVSCIKAYQLPVPMSTTKYYDNGKGASYLMCPFTGMKDDKGAYFIQLNCGKGFLSAWHAKGETISGRYDYISTGRVEVKCITWPPLEWDSRKCQKMTDKNKKNEEHFRVVCPDGYAMTDISMRRNSKLDYTCCPGPGPTPSKWTNLKPRKVESKGKGDVCDRGNSGCAEGAALRGLEMKFTGNGFHYDPTYHQTFECIQYTRFTLQDKDNPPKQFGYPPYWPVVSRSCGKNHLRDWKCRSPDTPDPHVVPLRDVGPLGTCRADIFVATPVPLTFSSENQGRCLNLNHEEPRVESVKSDVQWHCETSRQCFGYNITGDSKSGPSGPGSVFLEPVKGLGSDGNCHVKDISTWSPDEQSKPLALDVKGLRSSEHPGSDTEADQSLKSAYSWTSAIRVRSTDTHATLFTCLPNAIAPEAPASAPLSVLCASDVAVKLSDLTTATGFYTGSIGREVKETTIVPSCLSLVPPSNESSAAASMTGTTLMSLLRSQKFFSSPYQDGVAPPFNISMSDQGFQLPWTLGFASLTAGGRIMWGLACPDGAIVASTPRTSSHCLQVGAGSETVHEVLSGSAMCPPGTAVSGWYNLPGIPVKQQKNSHSGPFSWTSARLFCRRTVLLSNCQQPMDPHCRNGEVVSGLVYDASGMKMRCCQLQQPLGFRFKSNTRESKPYKSFEGYYCPTAVDQTGAPFYNRTSIAELGSPDVTEPAEEATLSWNKWLASWELRVAGDVVGSAASEVVSPIQLSADAQGNFSAVPISPLGSSVIKDSTPASPFPKTQPTYPKLSEFHAAQPDYAAYCDPSVLQNPALYSGSVEEGNPCYHTFNAEKPVPGLPKGITEKDFWEASSREKQRDHLFSGAAAQEKKMESKISKALAKTQAIFDGVAVAAAIASAIPWGSFAEGALETKNLLGKKAKAVQQKLMEKAIVRSIVSTAKAAYGHAKSVASTSVRLATKIVNVTSAKVATAKQAYNDVQAMGKPIQDFPGNVKKAKDEVKEKINAVEDKFKTDIAAFKEPSPQEERKASEKLQEETMPQPKPPGDSSGENAEKASEAAFVDWMPLRYGLSKVMCDLFCIHDSVRAGSSAILQSLESSHRVLTNNMQALLDYQTKYILWAVGTQLSDRSQLTSQTRMVARNDGMDDRWQWRAPTPKELLEELRVELPSESASLSRDVLGWHEDASAQLLSRAAAFTSNASHETWPFRAHALRGMLRHFRAHFAKRLVQEPEGAAQRQIRDKLEFLRDQSAQRRALGERARALRLWLPHSGPVTLDAGSQVLWSSLLEGFLTLHEKHNTFTMLRLQVLDDTDAALHVAANFSECAGADTSLLREAWQRVTRGEERANVALQEAWSSTLTAAERLRIAFEDESVVQNLVRGAVLDDESIERLEDCENQFHEIGQSLFGHAVEVANRVVQPLLMQLITFEALQGYQEEELQSRGLRYLPSPPNLGLRTLKTELAAAVDPSTPAGRALATRAMNVLGKRICPSPCMESTEAMLVARRNGTHWIAREPGRVLFGQAHAVACSPSFLDAGAPRGDWHTELNITNGTSLKAEECTSLMLMEALGV